MGKQIVGICEDGFEFLFGVQHRKKLFRLDLMSVVKEMIRQLRNNLEPEESKTKLEKLEKLLSMMMGNLDESEGEDSDVEEDSEGEDSDDEDSSDKKCVYKGFKIESEIPVFLDNYDSSDRVSHIHQYYYKNLKIPSDLLSGKELDEFIAKHQYRDAFEKKMDLKVIFESSMKKSPYEKMSDKSTLCDESYYAIERIYYRYFFVVEGFSSNCYIKAPDHFC